MVALVVEHRPAASGSGAPLGVQEHRSIATGTSPGHPVESQRLGEVERDQTGERLGDRRHEHPAVEGDEVHRREHSILVVGIGLFPTGEPDQTLMDVLAQDVVQFGGDELVESRKAEIDPSVVAQLAERDGIVIGRSSLQRRAGTSGEGLARPRR